MLQKQLHQVSKVITTVAANVMQSVHTLVRKSIAFSGIRAVALMSLSLLVSSLLMAYGTPGALAAQVQPQVQAKPPTDASFYMSSTDPVAAFNLGCNQGRADATASPVANSEVILDFGGQVNTASTKLVNGQVVTNAQIVAAVESFGIAYFTCTGTDTTSFVTLGIGTNNSLDVSYAEGQVWANVVAAVKQDLQDGGFNSQVAAVGANDIEPGFGGAAAAISWAQGYASVGSFYLNYGSADGCPQASSDNSILCNNGWHQSDIWYVSWGSPPAESTPEIYFPAQARQWAMISLYGAQSQGGAVIMQGPLDEFPLDNATLTADQSWTALWTDLNNNPATAQSMTYSLEIHRQ